MRLDIQIKIIPIANTCRLFFVGFFLYFLFTLFILFCAFLLVCLFFCLFIFLFVCFATNSIRGQAYILRHVKRSEKVNGIVSVP